MDGKVLQDVVIGPNPAADLRYFIGKGANRKAKARHPKYFTQDEGPRPRRGGNCDLSQGWSAFILTGLLAGLRWGESAALMRSAIDFGRERLHVQRTISGRGAVAPPKNGKDRWVKASPALLKALRGHLEAIDLDGSVEEWSPEQRQMVFPTSRGNLVSYPSSSGRSEASAQTGQAPLPAVPLDTAHVRDLAFGGRHRHPQGPAADGPCQPL